MATVDAFMAYAERTPEEGGEQLSLDPSARADIKPSDDAAPPDDLSAHADAKTLWNARRANAFIDMTRTAIKNGSLLGTTGSRMPV